MLGKKALQTGANVAQDVLAGENFSTTVEKHGKQAIGDLLPQAGAGRKALKKKTQFHQFDTKQETKNNSMARRTRKLRALVLIDYGLHIIQYCNALLLNHSMTTDVSSSEEQ